MKLAIFGATGRTGRPLVEQALAAGYEVKVLARNPAKLGIQSERLTLVQGDVNDAAKVEEVVQGVEAVLSVLGPTKDSPPGTFPAAARNIVAAMKKHGVKRLITLTGAGVDDPKDQPKLVNYLIKGLLLLLSPQVLKDAQEHVKVVRNSGLDWTVVRVPRLEEGPHTGKYRVGYVGKGTGTIIGRADVADFMLKQISETTYLHDAPMISN